jgi:sortase family protein
VSVVARRFRTRLVPALVTALGVALIATGLLSYTFAVEPAFVARPLASYNPLPTLNQAVLPGGSLAPGESFPSDRVATRVVIPRLQIDLPIILQQGAEDQFGTYPLCDVAMYLPFFSQPGSGRTTYLYAHARDGMFLPLLLASQVNDGKRLLGDLVQVYTSDNYRFLYQISEVRRHATDLVDAFNDPDARLWLQTSEGPDASYPKLQVIATFLSADKTDPNAAHPAAHPRQCQ